MTSHHITQHTSCARVRPARVRWLAQRFPVDAVRRFLAEDDHATWQHRLHVVGADLRDLKGLEALCDALPKLVSRLDIIINNACQTVRRPCAPPDAA